MDFIEHGCVVLTPTRLEHTYSRAVGQVGQVGSGQFGGRLLAIPVVLRSSSNLSLPMKLPTPTRNYPTPLHPTLPSQTNERKLLLPTTYCYY